MLRRVSSTVLFFAFLIFGLFSDIPVAKHCIFLVVVAVTCLGTREYYNLARRLKIRPSPWPGHLVAIAFLVDAYLLGFGHFVHIFITCFWALLFTQVIFKRYELAIANTATSLFGGVYVGLPMAILLYVGGHAERWGFSHAHAGGHLILFLVVTTWATDVGGYAIGKPFGRKKIAPILSPNKTLEGLIGGVLFSVIAGVLLKVSWPAIGRMFSWVEAVGLPVVFSGLGTVGDLAESAFKRDAQAKDSGETYTGHGGILDIIDSLLLAAPVFYLYLEGFKP